MSDEPQKRWSGARQRNAKARRQSECCDREMIKVDLARLSVLGFVN